MGTTTMGVKLDDATRERIKSAATRIDRTPHWLIKQAIFNYLEKLENNETLPELPALLSGAANESDEAAPAAEESEVQVLPSVAGNDDSSVEKEQDGERSV